MSRILCVSPRGKRVPPYEFGHKVSVVSTAKEQLVVNSQALTGNPYDGHTLDLALLRAKRHTGGMVGHILVDRGYRGSQDSLYAQVHITGKRQGSGKAHEDQHRRNAIEPIIGHMEQDGLLNRCHLKGMEGSRIHAVLFGVGQNLRKVLRHLRWLYFAWQAVLSEWQILVSLTGYRLIASRNRPIWHSQYAKSAILVA